MMRIDAYTHFFRRDFTKSCWPAALTGHRQAHEGRPGDLRPRRPPQGGRQVQGLRADPVLPDAAARDAGQGRRSRPRNTPRSSMTASPSSARNIPTISRAGSRRPRSPAPDAGVREAAARDEEWRARRADLHQRRRPAARRAGVRAVLRGDEKERQADLAASGARRELSRLPDREEIEIRNLVDARLVLRDRRGDGAAGVLEDHGQVSEAEDHRCTTSAASCRCWKAASARAGTSSARAPRTRITARCSRA